MNKIILTTLLFFLSYKVFPLSTVPNSFNGSALCDSLSTTYQIPQELQGKYYYKVEILKSDTSQYIEIKYHLQSAETDMLKQITTDLTKYFSSSTTPSSTNGDLKWNVCHKIYIDDLLKSTEFTIGWPYKPCYTSKSDCKKVFIYRKRLEEICPDVDVYITPYVKIVDDSILVNFKNITKPRDITCKALGTKVVTDSIVLNILSRRDYTIFHADTQVIYCVNSPCPPLTEMTMIGKAYFSNCFPVEGKNVFEGSILCKNLSVNLDLPKGLQGNYSYSYKAEFVQNSLIMHYYLKQDRVDWLEKINIPLNDILPPENLERNKDLTNIPVTQIIHLNGSLYVIQGYGQPNTRCFEYKTDCDKITLYRKYLHPICSPWAVYSKIAYRVEEEAGSIFAMLSDSLVFAEIVCTAAGNYVKRDSIEITNLKNLKYELSVDEIQKYYGTLIYKAPESYSWSSKVELNDCIVAGTDDAVVENNKPWPNPCTTEIHLKDNQGRVTFANQLGQLFVVEGSEIFNVADLPRGIYIVTLDQGGQSRREKVILK